MLTPNVVPDLDFEPWTHAMQSLEAALECCRRIERSLDHEEALALGAEVFRHLENVKGKSREYRNALCTEHEVRLILLRTHDAHKAREPIPVKLGDIINRFLREKLGENP